MKSINFDTILRLINAAFLIFCVLLFSGCGTPKEVLLSGQTMGTTYHITLVGAHLNPKDLKAKIDKRLEDINQSMSTYRKSSEISRFNNFRKAGKKFAVSDDFRQVMTVAKTIYELSEGAWDGTVKPLIDLWGFGSTTNKYRIPDKAEIQTLFADIGFNHIEIAAKGNLIKRLATVSVDLASIAKGYAVDQIAALIRKNGINDFLVEIGGEVFAGGVRKDGKPWRIGINRPKKNAPVDQVYKVVKLQNKSFATSGDYRIFFEKDGRRFSHIIDPRNGYPVTSGVVSASIVADNCTFADGLATAMVVLGAEKGLDLVNRLKGVEGLIVVQKKDGALIDHYSKNFKRFMDPKT